MKINMGLTSLSHTAKVGLLGEASSFVANFALLMFMSLPLLYHITTISLPYHYPQGSLWVDNGEPHVRLISVSCPSHLRRKSDRIAAEERTKGDANSVSRGLSCQHEQTSEKTLFIEIILNLYKNVNIN